MATKKATKKPAKKAAVKKTTTTSTSSKSGPQEIKTAEAIEMKKGDEPSLMPPDMNAIGVWSNNKKIVQTWGKSENRNAWLNIGGEGYRKIKDSNDSCVIAMLLMGAHARDKGSVVNVRTESDNMIYELYVW